MLHVLLIEDNPADVWLIREAIRTSSISADVTIANDGAQALKMLDDTDPAPDLVILDLNLPKLDGLDILERHPPDGGPPPVVVFTSSRGTEERRRAMALGASDYIEKPMTWDEYLAAIRGAIEKWTNRGLRRIGRGDVTK
jgi:DNA-binding response OmpR family regulator